MAPHRLFLATSLALLLALTATQTPDLVVEMFRHGARGPLNATFDPHPDYWGYNLNQLTPVGMRMHYLLGAAIQQHYSELLPPNYDPTTIYIRSTDVNRTIMSGYSHMYGVFQNNGPNLSNISTSTAIPPYASPLVAEMAETMGDAFALPNKYQPVPIHVVSEDEDVVLAPYMSCPMASDWSDANADNSDTLHVFQNDMSSIVQYLQSKGLDIQTFQDLYYAGDNALTNHAQEIELPANVNASSQYFLDLKFAFEWYTAMLVEGTSNQVELYAVNPLNAIAEYMNGTLNGTSNLNFVFLSAHDTTLMTLLAAFNITTQACLLENYRSQKAGNGMPYPNCTYPQYASNLIFEFYNTSEPYVIFYYNGLPVNFCGNSGLNNNCTFTQFQNYINEVTNGYTPTDFMNMCQFPLNVMTAEANKYKIVMIVLAVVCFLLIVALSVIIYTNVRRSKELREKDQLLYNQPNQDTLVGHL